MSTIANRTANVPSLTGIRGVAAIAVVIHHSVIGTLHGSGEPYVRGGWAVDLFFVLSGFVLTLNYLNRRPVNFWQFYSARFARIYPLFLFSSLLMAATAAIRYRLHAEDFHGLFAPAHIVKEILLATALPLVGSEMIWNDPTWSISVEVWVYILLFGALAFLATRLPPQPAAWSSMALAVVLVATLTLYADRIDVTRGWAAFARAAVGFTCGWAACRVFRECNVKLPANATDLLVLCVVVLIVVSGAVYETDFWFLFLTFPAIVFGLATQPGLARKFLSSRPLVYLGEISYSIYLMHPFVLIVLGTVLAKFGLQYNIWCLGVSAIVCSLGVSILTFNLIERPCRKMLKQLLDPADPPESKTAQTAF